VRRTPLAVALAFALLLGSAGPARAGLGDDLQSVKRRIETLRDQVGDSQDERTELANLVLGVAEELDAAVADLDTAEEALAETDAALADTEQQVTELASAIAEREGAIDAMRSEMGALRASARERAVQLYMQGAAISSLDVFDLRNVGLVTVGLVYAERVQQVVDRDISRYAALSAREQDFVDRLAIESAELEVQTVELETRRLTQARTAETVAARAAIVERRLAEQQAFLDELDHEIDHFEGEIAALAREQARIEQQIAYEQALAGRRPDGFLRPVPGGVSSGFGYRVHPIYGDRRLHTGWDLNAGCGEPIRAAADGRVIVNGWQGGYGLAVIIDHGGGMSTLYAHQTRTNVDYGQRVALGDVIGYIGSTGLSTACHLHFEVRLAGQPVDPADYL
jgi:murein DD-endopeptidase MepM/ murein hydrolase activator NlpD